MTSGFVQEKDEDVADIEQVEENDQMRSQEEHADERSEKKNLIHELPQLLIEDNGPNGSQTEDVVQANTSNKEYRDEQRRLNPRRVEDFDFTVYFTPLTLYKAMVASEGISFRMENYKKNIGHMMLIYSKYKDSPHLTDDSICIRQFGLTWKSWFLKMLHHQLMKE